MLTDFRLDSAGVREILRGDEVRTLVDGLAEDVAANVRSLVPAGTTIEVRGYTTDRGAATVVVADVQAMAWQARDGILTRAAASAGLEVRAWQR
ncbi:MULTISPECIES: hypothetical protein [Streptomyces]|jgi:hypothetical protein|uniref:Uncharacterized protein n=1 Tax=Streptomyces fradiae ATCC 10745 = DSM 40063 TaxID=1319510 RepID=A0A1Y2NSZ6_STRFR|nr:MULTISPECIES: hypothetical protein [Streptomyces]KAF0646709.1 hypothetical protein K701_27395 [Streptomyces fradiae ATCC 10745 = DSM 40063]OSY50596.1 hypothetical protein BG846_03764 [Streptomyces fradiae ATCC 10745 = DSM 40063]QEV11622.1 hypothetical protein CP974_05920 [Streptomyces fradiae ATCC 10745 = DSM 40063]